MSRTARNFKPFARNRFYWRQRCFVSFLALCSKFIGKYVLEFVFRCFHKHFSLFTSKFSLWMSRVLHLRMALCINVTILYSRSLIIKLVNFYCTLTTMNIFLSVSSSAFEAGKD